MSSPMTPTEEHIEAARAVRENLCNDCECAFDGGCVCLEAITAALAKAEREGMKRAAEIAKAHYDARHAALARAHGMNIATAILSEAGEGGQ